MENGVWGYQESSGYQTGTDLTGYRVEASDGHIGKVDEHSQEAGAGYLIVDTGPWIFGKQVMLPVGTITRIDTPNRTVHVGRTKDEIKGSPEFDRTTHMGDVEYQQLVGGYYGMWPI
ncbi:PRC-barrel domain containing protein [Streptacidiphilus sp. P02-A3a]|uniref:PRC-barrel domain containing protein n=1 Tax=Streptacidiphilus sp. P02-A3a TaxID=2704468 RepID=UPI0015FE4736|nr:PRC-barrel domain containing protein [Streptacidiphilus sp. P02-A3a]QMU70124.1 PRC-barrel domain containing protein [Streptacidiphilus sp. P02-A3a]